MELHNLVASSGFSPTLPVQLQHLTHTLQFRESQSGKNTENFPPVRFSSTVLQLSGGLQQLQQHELQQNDHQVQLQHSSSSSSRGGCTTAEAIVNWSNQECAHDTTSKRKAVALMQTSSTTLWSSAWWYTAPPCWNEKAEFSMKIA